MGMADSQFKAFSRLLLKAMDEADQEPDPAKRPRPCDRSKISCKNP